MKRLIIIIFILIGIGAAVYIIQIVYPNVEIISPEDLESLAPPKPGFYRGFSENLSLFFLFYEHPQYGLTPLQQHSLLRSNTVKLYAYSFKTQDLKFTIYSYVKEKQQIREGNVTKTIEVIKDERTDTWAIHVIAGQFTQQEFQLPTDYRMRYYEIKAGNRTLYSFRHKTYAAYLPTPAMTRGQLFIDRTIYIFGAVLVTFLGVMIAKRVVEHVKYVPPLPTWVIALLPMILIFSFGFGVLYMVYYLGLVQASYTYIPILVVAFFFGLYVLRPQPDIWYFNRVLDSEQPTKEVIPLEIIKMPDGYYIASDSWKDFIRGRKTKLEFAEDAEWYFNLVDGGREYYFTEMKFLPDKVWVKLSEPHMKEIDEYLSEKASVENVARAYHHVKRRYYKLKALLKKAAIVEGEKMSKHYIAKILEALELKPKVERKAKEELEVRPEEVEEGG